MLVKIDPETFMEALEIKHEKVDIKFLQNQIDLSIRTVKALRDIHISKKGCCPEITRKLEDALQYLRDVDIE